MDTKSEAASMAKNKIKILARSIDSSIYHHSVISEKEKITLMRFAGVLSLSPKQHRERERERGVFFLL